MELPDDVRLKIDRTVDHLHREFDGLVDRVDVDRLVHDSADRLAANSTVADNIPLLAYRFARERLMAVARRQGTSAQRGHDVVFVSLSGGGRGQLAAALTSALSGEQVTVHSAGTAVGAQLDPTVRLVLSEIGIESDEPFARPVTDEVLQGAGVIVTMGHSVGAIEIPADVRHEDWRIGDPIGAPLQEVRRVRADIEYRFRDLLSSLGIEPAERPSAAHLSSAAHES